MTNYFEELQNLQKNAYAPYSKFHVAAILITSDGSEIRGVNVENASFGGTICAERSAFVSAVSQRGFTGPEQYKEIHLLAGHSENFAMPCGFCRQVMSELVSPDFPILVYNKLGESQSFTMEELLPHRFSEAELKA